MIVESDKISWPENNQRLWRYMDFAKFLNLLENNSLFFCRTDKLDDQFEQIFPNKNVIELLETYKKFKRSLEERIPEMDSKMFLSVFSYLRQFSLVNSWHMNNYESVAMWNVYGKSSQAIAITTTFSNLSNELNSIDDEVHLGKVEYVDLATHKLASTDIISAAYIKTQSYFYEQELRALIIDKNDVMKPTFETGKTVTINSKSLIGDIYVSPNSPNYFLNLVQTMVNKYGIDKEVKRSSVRDNSLK